MKDVTTRLLEDDPTLERHNEGHWNEHFIPDSSEFSSFNDAGVEVETGEFLYAMVRMLKPDHVLETGTHWGVGASYMASACRDNNHGQVTTIEFLPEIFKRACERFERLGLLPRGNEQKWVDPRLQDVATFEPNHPYGMILLDTEPQTRFSEFLKFYPSLLPGGFIFIHDLHRHMHQINNQEHGFAWPYGPIPNEMLELVRRGEIRPFHFSTPRGLTGFYKVSPDDFPFEVHAHD